jgi:hypothetical protein
MGRNEMHDHTKIILDHLNLDGAVTTSAMPVSIDDGLASTIVQVMHMVVVETDEPCCDRHEHKKGIHFRLLRFIVHEVDDLIQFKSLDEIDPADLQNGRFRYLDYENNEAGEIVLDFSQDEPVIERTTEEM